MMRALQLSLFLLVALVVLGGIHGYLWLRLVRDPAWPAPWHRLAHGALLVLGLSLPLGLVLGRFLPFGVAQVAAFVPYVWMGTMLLLCALLVGADALRLGGWSMQRVLGGVMGPDTRLLIARVLALVVLLGASGLTVAAIHAALCQRVVRHVEVRLDRLPATLDGFTIVQLSDLHVGLTLGRDWLARVVEQVNGLRPDLIAITGDLADGSLERLHAEVAPIAGLTAPHGVFFVTGNHEVYAGSVWEAALEKMGIRVLRNEHVRITRDGAGFVLAGIEDNGAHGPDRVGSGQAIRRALEGSDGQDERVLLAHQPRAVEEAAAQDVGLVLSGHTHGGQLWPWTWLVPLQQPYVAGLHRHGPRTQIYVSPGTGFWGPPLRLGSSNEITVIRLRAGGR